MKIKLINIYLIVIVRIAFFSRLLHQAVFLPRALSEILVIIVIVRVLFNYAMLPLISLRPSCRRDVLFEQFRWRVHEIDLARVHRVPLQRDRLPHSLRGCLEWIPLPATVACSII